MVDDRPDLRVSGRPVVSPGRPEYARPEACALVVFGATGDLMARKLMPALYALAAERRLPRCFAVVGVARSALDDDAFRRRMREAVERHARLAVRDDVWDGLARTMRYLPSPPTGQGYGPLREVLEAVDGRCGTEGHRLFYLATPPGVFAGIAEALGQSGLARARGGEGWVRVVVEKPFGRDLESARALNRAMLGAFEERQIYRIDHYLGKETVQNVLALRFGNTMFEPLWNRRYVDHVQITVAEADGVGERGEFYDGTGALRDMVQNHLLQLLTLVAMEPPASFDAETVRDEKVKLLRAVRDVPEAAVAERVVRGQYGAGALGDRPHSAYRDEVGRPHSTTETFVAIALEVDTWRWAGVPFYLRTGKGLARRVSEITVQYRRPPLRLFERDAPPDGRTSLEANRVSLAIQPDERVAIRLGLKPPGERMRLVPVAMDFDYRQGFGADVPEAYERLLMDCMRGDPTLFIRGDEVEAAWGLMTPILQAWAAGRGSPLALYPAGSWGPAEADHLLARDGRAWVLGDRR